MVDDTQFSKSDPDSRGCRLPMLVGCGCLSVVAILGVAAFFLIPDGVWNAFKAIAVAKAERDRIYAEVLFDGDAVLSYGSADERFRQTYTEDQLTTYFREQPGLFNPPSSSISFGSQGINGKVVVSTAFESAGQKYRIYASKEGDRLRLLGISPELDQAGPPEFRQKDDPGR